MILVLGESKKETNMAKKTIIKGVTKVRLNVREKPNTSCDIIKVLPKGSVVKVVANDTTTNEYFYKVIVNDIVSGYCMKEFITLAPTKEKQAEENAEAEDECK